MRLIGLVVVLAASLALTPVDGGVQQRTGIPRIGVLRLDSPQGTDRSIAEFSQRLRELRVPNESKQLLAAADNTHSE
jgi:hypothetical protein